MASQDEYQQIQFWKSLKTTTLLCEEYKRSRKLLGKSIPRPPFCIEADKDGNCLMSLKIVMIDLSQFKMKYI